VRPQTALVTVVATAALLGTAWQVGSRHQPGALAGVHVISAPPSVGATTSPQPSSRTTTRPGSSRTGGSRATTSPSRSSSPSPAAPQVVRVVGAVVGTPYGDVQVRAVLRGNTLLDVQPLHLTDSGGHSRDLSAMAEPTLRQEALAAQSAKIDAVSGATYTSEGYIQSLQAALDAAHVKG
jgi:uncharacterized protein with FMN-binding domain